jgi:hypothetical protein
MPLANGDLYLVLASPALPGATLLVRQGGDAALWRRRLDSVDSVAIHESGASAVVRRVNQEFQLLKLDADGRAQWTAPLVFTSTPSFASGLFAAGPGSIAGFINGAQYCERSSAELPPQCVVLPDHGATLSGTIQIDPLGAWVYYRSPQQQLKVARIPRDGGAPVVATLAGENRTVLPLAANEEATWLRVVENGTSNLHIVRVSAAGAVAQATRPFWELQAVADGNELVAVFASPAPTVERFGAGLEVLGTAPFVGWPFRIDTGGTGRTCVLGLTEPSPGRIVTRCYGADLQPEPAQVLSEDAQVAFPFAIAVGADEALAHWGDELVPGGVTAFSTQSVVSRVPQAGPALPPQPVDRIDLPVSLGSFDALAKGASGDVAIFGSARVAEGTTTQAAAWAVRLPASGSGATSYKGPGAQGEPIVSGRFDGDDLLGWAQWTPPGAFFGLPPVSLRLHRIPAGGTATVPVALPSAVAGQRRVNAVLRNDARWVVAGTDLVEGSAGSLRFEGFVLAHDAAGAIEWQRRYVGGERGRPFIVETPSGLVVAHAWRDTEGAPGALTQCVVEGLSASGGVLWERSLPARTCGAIAASESADAVLVTAFAASSSELLVDALSAATGATLGASAIPFASGFAPTAVVPASGGWRVLSRVGSGSAERFELAAFDAGLALLWRVPLQTPLPPGRPALAALSGARVDVAVVSGGLSRSLLSRWRVAADGTATLVDRIDADAGVNTLVDARNFAVALLAVDPDTSVMAATLFEAGGNQVVRVSSRPDLMFQDSFD